MVLNRLNVCLNVAIIELKFNIIFSENFLSVVVSDPVGLASFWQIRISIQGLQIRMRIRIHFNQM